jgi:hypothetical protein
MNINRNVVAFFGALAFFAAMGFQYMLADEVINFGWSAVNYEEILYSELFFTITLALGILLSELFNRLVETFRSKKVVGQAASITTIGTLN